MVVIKEVNQSPTCWSIYDVASYFGLTKEFEEFVKKNPDGYDEDSKTYEEENDEMLEEFLSISDRKFVITLFDDCWIVLEINV